MSQGTGRPYGPDELYELLPAIYRIRDAEVGHPLRDLVKILAREAEIVERDLHQLYADWFIETCDEWVVPYIGDLLGVRPLPIQPGARFSRRAEVANTLHYRRGKGTARVLEELARDVTGWPAAAAVEMFQHLATTQYLNHLRPASRAWVDLRDAEALELLGGPFETATHTAEVRRVAPRRGRYNIPHVAIHLWRLTAYPLTFAMPRPVDDSGRRFTFSPLGHDQPLFLRAAAPESRETRTREDHVPQPLGRRRLHRGLEADVAQLYDPNLSMAVFDRLDGENEWQPVDRNTVVACNLADWTRPVPDGRVAVDPVRGRLVFDEDAVPEDGFPPGGPRVLYHYGFSDDLGGGPYERQETFSEIEGEQTFPVTFDLEDASADPLGAAIQDALAALGGATPAAVVEIGDSATYEVDLDELPGQQIDLPPGRRLEIRAANGQRPVLRLTHDLEVIGGADSAFELNGVVVVGADAAVGRVRVTGEVESVVVQHATLMPGRGFEFEAEIEDDPEAVGVSLAPGADSLVVESAAATLRIHRSILGPVRTGRGVEVTIEHSIVDAGGRESPAFAGLAGTDDPGGPLTVQRSTVIGTIRTREIPLGDSSIFLGVVTAEHRQRGCVRYSFVRPGSRVPRRYRCQPVIPAGATPQDARRLTARVEPCFTSLDVRHPGYAQLDVRGPQEILRGADDGSQMGVFSSLQQPQREDGLRIRLDEYLPVRLEAGNFYAT